MSVYVTDENGELYSLSGGSVPSENESNISNEAAEYYENLYDAAKDNLITHYKDECVITKRQTIGVFTKRSPHEFATNILTSILDLRPISGTAPTPIYYNTDMFELVDGIVAEYDMVFYGLEKNTKYTVSFSTFLNWTDTTMFGVHVPVDDTSEHVVEFVTDNRGAYTFERGFKMSPVDAYSVHAYQFGMLCLVKGDYSGTARQFGDVVTAVELNSITYDTFKRSKKYTDDTSKNKVDVVEGKSLSTNDYTNEDVVAVTFAEAERQKSKNLLVYPYTGEVYQYGVTFTDNGDGSFTINGKQTDTTANSYHYMETADTFKLSAGTYTLKAFADTSVTGWNLVLYDGTYYHEVSSPNIAKTLTFNEDKYCRVYIQVPKASTTTFNNFVVKPILVKGTEVGEWQPYNGAIVNEKQLKEAVEKRELWYDASYNRISITNSTLTTLQQYFDLFKSDTNKIYTCNIGALETSKFKDLLPSVGFGNYCSCYIKHYSNGMWGNGRLEAFEIVAFEQFGQDFAKGYLYKNLNDTVVFTGWIKIGG